LAKQLGAEEGENIMKVLIVVRRSPPQRYLVHLHTEKIKSEVRNLINSNRHSEAVSAAFTKGIFERLVHEDELCHLEADLILSESNAYWDLTR
jgi:hypothetical protein